MRQLLEQTNAYKILKGQTELSHAYLVFFADSDSLEKMMPVFSELFFRSADDRVKTLLQKKAFCDCLYYPKDNKKFSVEDAEAVQEECILKPVEADKKLFVFPDFSLSTTAAQNKMLKLLEEPPKGVYFLLGASVLSAVLPTVLSRVKTLEIPPFSLEETEKYLKRNYPQSENAKRAASASGGFPSKAENLLSGGFLNELSSFAFSLCLSPLSSLPTLCKQAENFPKKQELLSFIRMIFRDALVLKTGTGEPLLPLDKNKTEEVANLYSMRELLKAQDLLSQAEKDFKFNAVFPQTLELLFNLIR